MNEDLPPELRDGGVGRRRVQPLWWRVTTSAVAIVLIGLLVVAHLM
ncbi:hypothetical protein [Georgenia wutianyii]|nr:hypothetical protein [Georgenia wutianyii]